MVRSYHAALWRIDVSSEIATTWRHFNMLPPLLPLPAYMLP